MLVDKVRLWCGTWEKDFRHEGNLQA